MLISRYVQEDVNLKLCIGGSALWRLGQEDLFASVLSCNVVFATWYNLIDK